MSTYRHKFKVWDTLNKVMKDWNYVVSQLDITDVFGNKRFIPLQWTGLKDKNGNEIYNGDVVIAEYFNHSKASTFIKQIVSFEKGTFTLKSQEIELEMTRQNVPIHWADTIEIIGNIHQNPELIK